MCIFTEKKQQQMQGESERQSRCRRAQWYSVTQKAVRNTKVGLIPRCSKGFFFQGQLKSSTLVVVPLSGRTEILHALVSMGSAALVSMGSAALVSMGSAALVSMGSAALGAAVPYPGKSSLNDMQAVNELSTTTKSATTKNLYPPTKTPPNTQ